MEVQYCLPGATKLVKVDLDLINQLCCDEKLCHLKAPSTAVLKEKTILKTKQNLVGCLSN